MTAYKTTKKEFGVHPSIIYSIVLKQASGIPKALLELAMNSVDAGATEIDLQIDENGFTFSDNGKGFKDIEEVEKYFGTYGTPREVESYYGRFRIGRAQIQCYAATDWYSRDFCMHVDLNIDINDVSRQEELGYSITLNHPFYQGCQIVGRFYKAQRIGLLDDVLGNEYTPENSTTIIPAFKKMVKYLPVTIRINGKKVNFDLDRQAAYETTESAVYLLEPQTGSGLPCINVYNKGVYAYQINSTNLAGDVVSLEKIDLNMARNQAKATCPIGRHIKRKVSSLSKALDTKSNGNSDRAKKIENLQSYIDDIWAAIFGLNEYDFNDLKPMFARKVITSIDDQKHSIKNIVDVLEYYGEKPVVIYNFEKCQETIFPASKDFMKLKSNYIPDTFLPSQEFLDRIVSKVSINAKLFSFGNESIEQKINKRLVDNKSSFFHFDPERFNVDRNDLELQTYLIRILYILVSYSPSEDQNVSIMALSLYESMFDRFEHFNRNIIQNIQIQPLTVTLINAVNSQEYITDAKLDKLERLILRCLKESLWYIYSCRIGLGEGESQDRRELAVKCISSEDILAYTDGSKQIAFNEAFFRQMVAEANFEYLIEVMIHEYAHISSSLESNAHGATFNARFKYLYLENFSKCVNSFYEELLKQFNVLLRKGDLISTVQTNILVKVLNYNQDAYAAKYA